MKFIFILTTGLILLSSCRKETSWDADWVVPIINDTLDLANFVNDTTLDISSGYYTLSLKRNLFDFNLTDFVGIPDTTIEQDLTLQIVSLNVSPGTEFVSSTEEHELNLQDIELKRIDLKDGFIDLTVENPIETSIVMTIQLPGVTKNGVTLSQSYTVPASNGVTPGILSTVVDLADYSMDLKGANGSSFNKLQSVVSVKTVSNGPAVVVTNQDHTIVKAKFRDVRVNYARGYFGNRIIEDTTDFNIDFFDNITAGMIDIPSTSVKIKIENGIKFDAQGKIDFLKSTNAQMNDVYLSGANMGSTFQIDQPVGSWEGLQPTIKVVEFNSGNSNIEQYIENLGSKNKLAYAIQVNPWGNTSGGWNEVFPQSRLKMSVEAQMPLLIQMDDVTIKDTFEFELNQSQDKTHVSSGIIHLDVENGFPFSGAVILYFYDKNKQLIGTTSASNSILSSQLGSVNYQGVLTKKSTIEIPFSAELITSLADIKFMAIEAKFNSPNMSNSGNEMVSIPSNAFFAVKAKAKFILKTIIK